MGEKLSKKGFGIAYEKPIAQRVEKEATSSPTVMPEKNEEAHPASVSIGPTTEKTEDSQVPDDETEDKESSKVPATGTEEISNSKPKLLDLMPNEEQLRAAASQETTKSPEVDPSQLLEETATKGVGYRQEGDAE